MVVIADGENANEVRLGGVVSVAEVTVKLV